ncbi:phosphotransferase family protein [Brevibacillus sp. SYSU BS000544]|uniref:phosphotransferase family protein n=1 Tax=Brevibacillus sp. SYSU BS000544 TaxID=3416443 RepID=UPI003CE4CC1F
MTQQQVRKGEELPIEKLERYLCDRVEALQEHEDSPLEIKQFREGASNLTYALKKGAWEAVLRRPPLGPVAPKAHDMAREFKLLKELNALFPLAPQPFFYCEDDTVLGAPFFVMERKHGVVLDTEFPEPYQPTPQLCKQISETMVDRLVELHAVDYELTGLGEMGHPDGFMERQVKGWVGRYERAKTEEMEQVAELQQWMINQIPVSQKPTIIHYDYKLNNVMFDKDDLTKMIGVFDWEMTTIGDPLADLGVVLSYWTQDNDPPILRYGLGKPSVTILPGFMTRQEFIEAYAKKSGRDVSHIHFYQTFAYFKLAVICQQIYFRWKMGQTQDQRFAQFGEYTRSLIQVAGEAAKIK